MESNFFSKEFLETRILVSKEGCRRFSYMVENDNCLRSSLPRRSEGGSCIAAIVKKRTGGERLSPFIHYFLGRPPGTPPILNLQLLYPWRFKCMEGPMSMMPLRKAAARIPYLMMFIIFFFWMYDELNRYLPNGFRFVLSLCYFYLVVKILFFRGSVSFFKEISKWYIGSFLLVV